MSPRLSRHRTALAVATAAILGTALFSGTATAATSAEPVSTPVPIVTPDGMLMSYILNSAKAGNPGQVQVLSNAVRKAGGVVVQSWPEIGVVVAHSDRAAFRANVAASAGAALESVGATRTVSVSEDTPDGMGAMWAPGASSYKKGAKKDYNGDLPTEETPATSVDPRETEQWDMKMIKADQAHQITDGSRNVLVGVLDSGIDPDHPDLAANIDKANSVNCTDAGRPDLSPTGWFPTTSDHGTHVAGTIAAARNGVGIVGVAPNVRMAAVKVVNDAGFIYPEYAVCGFVWAGLKHMDVTNNSYYVDPFEFYCEDQPDQYAAKEAVRRAVAWSTEQGVVHAAAAGNSAHDLADKSSFKDTGSPDDGVAVSRTLNSGCQDIPTELPGRGHGVLDAERADGVADQPVVELQQPRSRHHRRGGSRVDDPVDDRGQQRLRHQERHLDGLPARRGRARPDEVGPPHVDAGPDGREAAHAGRRQGVWSHQRWSGVRRPCQQQQLLR